MPGISLDPTNYNIRRWTASEAPDVDTKYYLGKYGPVGSTWGDHIDSYQDKISNIHFADYVRASPDLASAWLAQRNAGQHTMGRWEWGAKHFREEAYPRNEHRILPFVVGGMKGWDTTDVIHWDPSDPDKSKHAFAAWHYGKGGGKEQGNWASHSQFYNSPGEVAKRQADRDAKEAMMKQQMEDAEMARLNAQAEGREAGRLAGQRGGSSSTLGSAGVPTMKGKGLESSINKRGGGRGTTQWRRPYSSSGLSIAGGAVTNTNQHNLT